MKKKLSILFIALVMAVLAACGNTSTSSSSSDNEKAAEPITVKHDLGETKVDPNPKKVVVFDMGILDTLDKLGVEVAGVPQDSLPEYLSK